MSKLTLSGGKFYRDGKEVPPVFGDTEQIALLKEREKDFEVLQETGGIQVDIDREEVISINLTTTFICLCGNKLKIRIDDLDEYCDEEEELSGQSKKCHQCQRKYELFYNDPEGEIMAKLIE